MPHPSVPAAAALLLAAVPGGAAGPDAPSPDGYRVAQLVVQQRLVVRVQSAAPKPVAWREKKGPKCVPLDRLAGALVVEPDAVDLVLAGGERLRARLDDDCPALNFYRGFYLKPAKDGKLCAGRDAIRSRAGRTCEVDALRRLVLRK